jgi:hypothetical protein
MTRDKLLALARNTPSSNGFKVEYIRFMKGTVPLYKVRLDPGEGFTIEYPVLLTTKNQATACEARDRYWMWLHKEGLTRG